MLRDRFVVGIQDASTQRMLLIEYTLDFSKAVAIATAREIAEKDVRDISGGAGPVGVNAVSSTSNKSGHTSNFKP